MPKTPTRALLAAAAAVLLFTAACEKDPHDIKTWIPKLQNPNTLDEAVRNLDRLKDTRAIKPLGEAWKKWNKPSKLLRAIVNIASFNDPTGKEAPYIKRTPDYKEAIPYLIEAVEGYEVTVQSQIDDASIAAEALGRSKDPAALPVLIKAAQRPLPKSSPANKVRATAIKALGNFNSPEAVNVLIKVLEADPEQQDIRLHAAAALALAETGNPKALPALAVAAFVGPIYNQVRQGFTRGGKEAVGIATDIFKGKQPEVAAYAKAKNFDKTAPGALAFKGALLLGDLRATEAVPMLVAGLKEESKPIAFHPQSGLPLGFSHDGIFEALKRIGDPKAADALWAYVASKDVPAGNKPMALDAYSCITSDTSKLDEMRAMITNEKEDPGLRVFTLLAYARLARTEKQQKAMEKILADEEKRGKELDAEIKKGGSDEKLAELDSLRLTNEQLVKAIKDEVLPRIEPAVACGEDPACYLKYVVDPGVEEGKASAYKAERALLELRKMGDKAAPVLDALLDKKILGTSVGTIRNFLLLALPRIAPLPCEKCVTAMDAVLTEQANQSTMDALTLETRIVYNYFLWAGK